MPRAVFVGLVLAAALVFAALAGIEYVAGRHTGVDAPSRSGSRVEAASPSASPSTEFAEPSRHTDAPGGGDAVNAYPSAGPTFTR